MPVMGKVSMSSFLFLSNSLAEMRFSKSIQSKLRAKHVAQMLNCSVSHVSNLVKMKKLHRTQIGPRTFIYDYRQVLLLAKNGI